MNSGETNTPSGQNKPAAPRGQTRPPAPDTPELSERRAHAPAAQALIKATRRLFAEGGPEWATDKRIHDTATRPGGRKGFPLGTIRYYFGGREQLLVHLARYEHLAQLDRVRRALRKVNSSEELTTALLSLAGDLDHFQVSFGLMSEARQMPELRVAQAALSEDWIAKLSEMVGELKARGVAPAGQDPRALALLWSSLTAGLAAHHLANPQIDLQPALDLAQLYANPLQ
jgi:AcrR family transcriptional regulator